MKQFSLRVTNTQIPLQIVKHHRARKMTLRISAAHGVRITIPKQVPYAAGFLFAKSHAKWISEHYKPLVHTSKPSVPSEKNSLLRIQARQKIRERISYFNTHYKFTFSRITIRKQKTRWGSCSSNGTLSFNVNLILIPEELLDYVVVHELCHLKQMNHSSAFWDLVAQTIPDYPMKRKELRKYEYLV